MNKQTQEKLQTEIERQLRYQENKQTKKALKAHGAKLQYETPVKVKLESPAKSIPTVDLTGIKINKQG